MKQLHYVLQTLLRGRGSNIIKVISLTLGLFVGILLFARVSFELSFDSSYHEPEKLCVVNATYVIGGEKREPETVVMGPVPEAIGTAFPAEIEGFTLVSRWYGDNTLFYKGVRLQPKMIMSDSLFFQTLGIDVLQGDPRELANPDRVFVSESFARKVFGSGSPIDQTLLYNKTMPMTVKGVYADLPENSSLRHEVVISFATIVKNDWLYTGWDGGDSFQGFIRLRQTSDLEKVNARIDQVIEAHMPYRPESGFGVKYSLQPIREVYVNYPSVHKMVMIMSLLGIAILLIASLNYVLISISSLATRSKSVGVHKCNGASSGTVFGMFLWETALIIFVSLVGVVLILFNFRAQIEDIASASLGALFTLKTLWVPLTVVVLLFLIAGVLPGRMLATIPVTQLFRRYTDGKSGWKRSLLFVQFAGVTFIFGLLCVVLLQYHRVMTKELGYDADRVAFAYFSFPGGNEGGRDALRLLPMVEGVAVAGSDITSGYGGMPVRDENGKALFTARINDCTLDYPEFMGIRLTAGRQMRDSTECLVNENLIRRTGWEAPLGMRYAGYTIVGVMEDFPINDFYVPQDAVALIGNRQSNSCWHVRLKAPFEENLRAMNKRLEEMVPGGDVVFKSLPATLAKQYEPIRRFRDAVILAALSILLIALMGLVGYVNDETHRRSKEIAIRKVNGAEASSILRLLSRDIALTAAPAALLGTIGAYYIGGKWLDQFAEQINLNPLWFVCVALGVLLVVVASVLLRAWRIANENPVHSIKSE